MNKARIVSALGILVVLLPYLGFPNSWRKILFVCIGVTLIYLGYHIHRMMQTYIVTPSPTLDKKPRITAMRTPRKILVKKESSPIIISESIQYEGDPLSFSKEEE